MAGARAFLEGWKRLLEELGPGELVITTLPSDEWGRLKGTIRIGSQWLVDVYLRRDQHDPPDLHRYSVQLRDAEGREVLRYDNAPHHEHLPGAPHHVHDSGGVAPVIPAPSLRVMIAAVRNTVGEF